MSPQLIPNTQTVSVFSYNVYANGLRIGNAQTFSPSSSKTLVRVREIGSSIAGETQEIVPGVTDHQLTFGILEMYRIQTLKAFGYTSFASIEDLKDPIDIKEIITKPNGEKITIDYLGCQIQNFSKSINIGGTIVTDNVTLWAAQVREVK